MANNGPIVNPKNKKIVDESKKKADEHRKTVELETKARKVNKRNPGLKDVLEYADIAKSFSDLKKSKK